MKKQNFKPQLFVAVTVALVLSALILVAGLSGGTQTAKAYYNDYSESGRYAFYYKKFDVTFDVETNRKISVREELTVHYKGSDCTGFLRDIPVNGGELVRNIRVSELANGEEIYVPYTVESYQDDNAVNYISADIGSRTNKTGEIHTYILSYDYCLTKAQEGKNELAINAVGPQDRRVESSTITFILPEGLRAANYVIGTTGTHGSEQVKDITHSDGKIIAKVENVALAYNEGITFGFTFGDGVLSTYFDFTPYWFIIAIIALMLIIVIVKVTLFNKRVLTPVVNFEAPDNMDPLIMGKLIDNVVDTEDISSMIFYWADKGYIKIGMDDPQNPVLIRLVQNLPEACPAYEKMLFAGLFRNEDSILPRVIPASFHTETQKVIASVNKQAKNFYEKKSVTVSIVFAVIGAAIAGLMPLLFTLTNINLRFSLFDSLIPLLLALPSIVVYALGRVIKDRRIKFKENTAGILIWVGVMALITLGMTVFYCVFIPAGTISLLPKALTIIACYVSAGCSSIIVTRTKEYNEKLGQIVGFRNFIKLAEKDKLEKMLEDNPQFYYHVLPYAQVLGVSDVWEDKFANIALPPPSYVTYSHSAMYSYLEFRMLNNAFRHLSRTVSNKIVPPSSSGGSGRGGFSGGHSGGGHGGGGSRGR